MLTVCCCQALWLRSMARQIGQDLSLDQDRRRETVGEDLLSLFLIRQNLWLGQDRQGGRLPSQRTSSCPRRTCRRTHTYLPQNQQFNTARVNAGNGFRIVVFSAFHSVVTLPGRSDTVRGLQAHWCTTGIQAREWHMASANGFHSVVAIHGIARRSSSSPWPRRSRVGVGVGLLVVHIIFEK